MKRFHLVFGIAAAVVFLLTGQYMAIYQNHLQGMADMSRFLYRSRHIYILMASLLNLTLGTYLIRQPGGWRRRLQCVGSVVVVIATCMLVAAFIREPLLSHGGRTPLSLYGIILIAIGTVVHAVGGASSHDK